MHPTNTLLDEMETLDGKKAHLKKVFPSKAESVRLSLLNLIFPYFSLTMLFFFGTLHAFTTWILQTKRYASGDTLMVRLSEIELFGGESNAFFTAITEALSHNPGAIFLNVLLFIGIMVFTDVKSYYGKWNYLAGFVHALLHLVNFYVLLWLFSRLNLLHFGLELESSRQVILFALEMILVGGIISGVLFGIYLTFSVLVLKNHITEASSSYRWEGYKNFLRLHLDKDGLTIYPIGFKTVVSDWSNTGDEDSPKFEGSPVNYSLIESPIVINHEKAL